MTAIQLAQKGRHPETQDLINKRTNEIDYWPAVDQYAPSQRMP